MLVARAEQAEAQAHKLKVAVGQHARARFGRRSEQQHAGTGVPEQGGRRGQRHGARGHGRRRDGYAGLPELHVLHDVPEECQACANCGRRRVAIGEETAEELDVELVVRRLVHHRRSYVAACACPGTERIIRGAAPPKLIPRGSLSVGTIASVVTARYMWGLPLHRITTILRQHGARVPDGTLVGVFKTVQPLLEPLYEAICARNRQSEYLHADETTWRQRWLAKGKRGYIWCFVGLNTTVYVFDPGRDHTVVLKYLELAGTTWGGQVVDLMCDFLASYDKAAKLANATARRLALSRCWSHYRRLFLDIPAHHPGDRQVAAEVEQWLGMIADLFRLHHQRDLAADGSEEQQEALAAFRGCLQEMEEVRAQHLRRRKLAPELRHVLEFGALHWEELTRCADDPHHPMDNNLDERQERLPVVIRKNAYGSGALWAAAQACQVWTIGQTALQNGRQPLALIRAYFEACAQAGGRVPADWVHFLPWVWEPEPAVEAAIAASGPAATVGGAQPTPAIPADDAALAPQARPAPLAAARVTSATVCAGTATAPCPDEKGRDGAGETTGTHDDGQAPPPAAAASSRAQPAGPLQPAAASSALAPHLPSAMAHGGETPPAATALLAPAGPARQPCSPRARSAPAAST